MPSQLLAIHADPRDGVEIAEIAKALADPVRVQIVSVLRGHDGEVCQCELTPLFEISQSTLSHHLKKLQEVGLVTVSRRSKWAYYSLDPDALEVLKTWLS
jgi:ArsR family transcriptional regulator